MARTVAGLPAGSRITDFISLGVIGKAFPLEKVKGILESTGKTSRRQRDLPAHVMMYYVIALAFPLRTGSRFIKRCWTRFWRNGSSPAGAGATNGV